MLTVYNCVANDHDLRLVVLAVTICALASFAAINLLHHVGKSTGRIRYTWLGVSATTTGFGIWATHFIAMLAYTPGLASGYDFGLMSLSLLCAIALTGVGLTVAVSEVGLRRAWLGGAIVGGGIAAMHYTGMAAFQVEGWIAWDATLVVSSILLGALFGAAALLAGLRDASLGAKIQGALLLTLAICSHHFTAMGAVSIMPDPTYSVSPSAVPSSWLAMATALASIAIILLALAGVALDIRDRRTALEAERMRGLVNAAVEGLIVCDGETIVTVNDSFTRLIGSAEAIVGARLATMLYDASTHAKLLAHPNQPLEADLRRRDGTAIPVELILRPVDFAGRSHDAIAVRDLRARKQAERHIRFLAHHDALTGLPNRSSFNRKLDLEIQAALASGHKLAVLCLDLDRFKEINDLFGHAAGDSLLQAVATRVTSLLERGQMLARLGGDEFALIMPCLNDSSAPQRMAERIIAALATEDDGIRNSYISSSIGIAILPDDGWDRQTLLSHADTALYRAKREGRGTYCVFEGWMAVQMRDRRQLEHDLHHAAARGELNLVYQPQVEIHAHEVVGFEALLRWQHAGRHISPAVFVPIAEENGSILEIGEWVLRTACREAARWPQPLTVAVNVSVVQLHNPNLAGLVHEVLLQTGLSPHRLELEITESALIRDLDRALATLRHLKALGVRIAVDDFGVGYSSLANLRVFPFDKIKIDRSFIKAVHANHQTATIVRAVLGLGRGLGVPVLAEGVETEDELAFLENEGCDEAQGYHLGRPEPIELFRAVTHGEKTRRIDRRRVMQAAS